MFEVKRGFVKGTEETIITIIKEDRGNTTKTAKHSAVTDTFPASEGVLLSSYSQEPQSILAAD